MLAGWGSKGSSASGRARATSLDALATGSRRRTPGRPRLGGWPKRTGLDCGAGPSNLQTAGRRIGRRGAAKGKPSSRLEPNADAQLSAKVNRRKGDAANAPCLRGMNSHRRRRGGSRNGRAICVRTRNAGDRPLGPLHLAMGRSMSVRPPISRPQLKVDRATTPPFPPKNAAAKPTAFGCAPSTRKRSTSTKNTSPSRSCGSGRARLKMVRSMR